MKINLNTDNNRISTSQRDLLFRREKIPLKTWKPKHGRLGDILSVDMETRPIENKLIPDLVLASAFDGKVAWLIKPRRIEAFIDAHRTSHIIGHSINFDLMVIRNRTGLDIEPLLEDGKIIDISILYRLIELAESGIVPHTNAEIK